MVRPVKCVDVEVDYPGKKITITVRIDFYLARIGPLDRRSLPEERQRVKDIANGISNHWNGHKFKCFDVIFILDWRFVEFHDRFRDNALDVGLDMESSRTNAFVLSAAGSGRNPLSDSPSDRVEPGTQRAGTRPIDRGGGSIWPLWAARSTTYAHEVGHILGLDNGAGAVDGEYTLVPGHPPDDIMTGAWNRRVLPETITKVIRRSGKVDESRIRCPITLDMGPMDWNLVLMSLSDIRVHSWVCDHDPPSSDPSRRPRPLAFEGFVEYSGEMHMQIGDPLGLGAEGRAHYGVRFTLPIPGNLDILGQGIHFYGEGIEWSSSVASGVDPLPYLSSGVMYLVGPDGQRLSTEVCWPGPKLVPVFRHGAPECEQ